MGYRSSLQDRLLAGLDAERRGWIEQIDKPGKNIFQVYNSTVQMGVAPLSERCVYCDDGTSEFCRPHAAPDGAYNRAFWHVLKSKKLLAPLRAELLKDIKTTAKGMDDCHQVASKPFAKQLLTYLTDNPRGWWDTRCTLWVYRTSDNTLVNVVESESLRNMGASLAFGPEYAMFIHRGPDIVRYDPNVALYTVYNNTPKGCKKLRPCVQVDGEMIDLKDFINW